MAKTVVVTEQALRDLEEIHDYIARDKPLAAKKLIKQLQRKFQTLATFPELGASCDQIQTGLRSHAAGSYVIFFEPITAGIRVVRVAHGRRS
ncbi:MAG TPA: type II toxin-antitoxin system RelE/ParE family toxin [Pirellulales bacterium]|nr:type II toxin-antitoxin system RelE/ParE family toxin [Pirellulales bacterium]